MRFEKSNLPSISDEDQIHYFFKHFTTYPFKVNLHLMRYNVSVDEKDVIVNIAKNYKKDHIDYKLVLDYIRNLPMASNHWENRFLYGRNSRLLTLLYIVYDGHLPKRDFSLSEVEDILKPDKENPKNGECNDLLGKCECINMFSTSPILDTNKYSVYHITLDKIYEDEFFIRFSNIEKVLNG